MPEERFATDRDGNGASATDERAGLGRALRMGKLHVDPVEDRATVLTAAAEVEHRIDGAQRKSACAPMIVAIDVWALAACRTAWGWRDHRVDPHCGTVLGSIGPRARRAAKIARVVVDIQWTT